MVICREVLLVLVPVVPGTCTGAWGTLLYARPGVCILQIAVQRGHRTLILFIHNAMHNADKIAVYCMLRNSNYVLVLCLFLYRYAYSIAL